MDTLSKAVFLLAGGALTLSINSFTGKNAAPITQDLIPYIKASWGLLFYSMAAFLLTISFMLVSMFFFGERWRSQLDGGEEATHLRIEPLQFFLVGSGLLGFIIGFALIAYVAIGMVGINI